ncbi:MAG: DNA translocase FtsK 4TM domain-containing protein, partial [Candidatus Dormibacteraeota bacterium]|nr:DNA translocase FtsK 4TM domain-containing protein [Candidatus Dormibacteraeota bacterium]
MARSAPARRRPARRRAVPAKRGRISVAGRRAPATRRAPLLSPDLRREISGVGSIGLGLLIGAVLLMPGGGAVAGPLHDWLFGALGVGAWLAVIGLIVTGGRLCLTSEWGAGTIAATGCGLTVLALLGLLGLAAPASAGALGRWIGPGIGTGLGRAGATALLIAFTAIGLVMATELRVGPVLRAAAEWLTAARERTAAPDPEEPGWPRPPAPGPR